MRTPISFVIALLILACSSAPEVTAQADDAPPLGIEQPPEGELGAEQLEAIAADIRRLEERPLAGEPRGSSSGFK